MASENMMSECAERIISEDYADFIIEIGFRENEARQEYKNLCIQDIGYKFSAIYYPLSEINPISVGEDTYIAIPKLFGLMDTSAVEATGALRLQRVRGTSLTGNGVIVGFIDTGIDYTNDIFKNVTGRTRILSIWDQSDQSGTHPQGIEFGSEYTREDIDRALQSEKSVFDWFQLKEYTGARNNLWQEWHVEVRMWKIILLVQQMKVRLRL